MPRLAVLVLLSACAFAGAAHAAPDGARPMRDVLELAATIGPRKSGTEGDRRAVEYVRREMEAAGLQVSLQEVATVPEADAERAVGSWNVLGRLEGTTPDLIVVAAHHDSRSVVVPGANDDASGLAVLLEVARATAARPRRTGYLFASFCAEEEGLIGSRFFARGADLSHVRAVIALELLGRGGILVGPVPKPPPPWAQEALLRAARETGARGVVTRPLWTLVPRFADLPYTADHESFLEQGIPAFLLMGTFPAWTYHTSEDTVSKVRPEALARAVLILDRIVRDLEERPPSVRPDPHYLPVGLFGQGVVVPGRVLAWIALAALGGSALLALARLRSVLSGRAIMETLRVLIVTSAATAIGLSGLFAPEAFLEWLHGARFPWSAHQRLYLGLGLAGLLATSWFGLKLFRRIKPTIDPGPYFAAALLVPLAATVAGLRFGWPELAAAAATPILALLLSRWVERPARKLALGGLGILPLLMVLSPEDYRAAMELGGFALPAPLLLSALLLALLPFVLFVAHVASFQDCLHSPLWRWLSGRWVGLAGLLALIGLLVPCALLPAYSTQHPQVVEVRQRVDLAQGRAQAVLHSADALDGVRLGGIGGPALSGGESIETVRLPVPKDRVAFEAAVKEDAGAGERAIICKTRLKAPRATDRVSYLFTSRSGFRVPGRDTVSRHSYAFTDIAPKEDPERDFTLLLPEEGDLAVSVRADFALDLLGLEPAGGARIFVHQGTIVGSRRLLEPRPAPAPRGPGAAEGGPPH